MVAQVVSTVGIPMGDGPLMSASPENPAGFFERIDLMEVNDQLLRDLGGAWYAPPAVTPETWASLDNNKLSYFRNSIDLLKSPENAWFIKDPRLSLIIPIWDRLALQALPAIFVIRNPTSVAQSLHLRNGFSYRKGLSLWWAYNAAIISELANREFLVIDYDTALRQKTDTVAGLFAFTLEVSSYLPNSITSSTLKENSWTSTEQVDFTIKQKQASKVMQRELTRNRAVRKLPGVASEQLRETLEMYQILKEEHGYQNSDIANLEIPDWVHEELHNSRIDYRNRLVIDDLTDRIAVANIEINTLKESIPEKNPNEDGQLHSNLEQIATLESERNQLDIQLAAIQSEIQLKNDELAAAHTIAQAHIVNFNRLGQKLFQFEVERNSAQSQVLSLHAELEDLRIKFDRALSATNEKTEEALSLHKKLETLESDWSRAESRVLELHTELLETRDKLKDTLSESANKTSRLQHLSKALSDLENAHSKIHLVNSSSSKSLIRAQSALSAITKELVQVTTQLYSSQAENALLNEKISELNNELAQQLLISKNLEKQLMVTLRSLQLYLSELQRIRGSRMYKFVSFVWQIRSK